MKIVQTVANLALLTLSIGVFQWAYAQDCQEVDGEPGASEQWGSGWIDVPTTTEFERGDRLRLAVGGTASRVLVRVLRSGQSPGDPVGIVGEFAVPASRIVEVALGDDFREVIQISVHGGPNPWGRFPLGGGNGPATLLRVERCLRLPR